MSKSIKEWEAVTTGGCAWLLIYLRMSKLLAYHLVTPTFQYVIDLPEASPFAFLIAAICSVFTDYPQGHLKLFVSLLVVANHIIPILVSFLQSPT